MAAPRVRAGKKCYVELNMVDFGEGKLEKTQRHLIAKSANAIRRAVDLVRDAGHDVQVIPLSPSASARR